jgi:hypothetical protein
VREKFMWKPEKKEWAFVDIFPTKSLDIQKGREMKEKRLASKLPCRFNRPSDTGGENTSTDSECVLVDKGESSWWPVPQEIGYLTLKLGSPLFLFHFHFHFHFRLLTLNTPTWVSMLHCLEICSINLADSDWLM